MQSEPPSALRNEKHQFSPNLDHLQAVLTSPSTDSDLHLQTPLMAAACSGVFAVYSTLLGAVDRLYAEASSVGSCLCILYAAT